MFTTCNSYKKYTTNREEGVRVHGRLAVPNGKGKGEQNKQNTYPCFNHRFMLWHFVCCWIFVSVSGAKRIRLNAVISLVV